MISVRTSSFPFFTSLLCRDLSLSRLFSNFIPSPKPFIWPLEKLVRGFSETDVVFWKPVTGFWILTLSLVPRSCCWVLISCRGGLRSPSPGLESCHCVRRSCRTIHRYLRSFFCYRSASFLNPATAALNPSKQLIGLKLQF